MQPHAQEVRVGNVIGVRLDAVLIARVRRDRHTSRLLGEPILDLPRRPPAAPESPAPPADRSVRLRPLPNEARPRARGRRPSRSRSRASARRDRPGAPAHPDADPLVRTVRPGRDLHTRRRGARPRPCGTPARRHHTRRRTAPRPLGPHPTLAAGRHHPRIDDPVGDPPRLADRERAGPGGRLQLEGSTGRWSRAAGRIRSAHATSSAVSSCERCSAACPSSAGAIAQPGDPGLGCRPRRTHLDPRQLGRDRHGLAQQLLRRRRPADVRRAHIQDPHVPSPANAIPPTAPSARPSAPPAPRLRTARARPASPPRLPSPASPPRRSPTTPSSAFPRRRLERPLHGRSRGDPQMRPQGVPRTRAGREG